MNWTNRNFDLLIDKKTKKTALSLRADMYEGNVVVTIVDHEKETYETFNIKDRVNDEVGLQLTVNYIFESIDAKLYGHDEFEDNFELADIKSTEYKITSTKKIEQAVKMILEMQAKC